VLQLNDFAAKLGDGLVLARGDLATLRHHDLHLARPFATQFGDHGSSSVQKYVAKVAWIV
jgi:hypothetical protein